MISLDSDVIKVQQIALENQKLEKQSEVKNTNTKIQEQEKDISPATNAEISAMALSEISSLIVKEDALVTDFNAAKDIYNSLGDIRLKLASFMKELETPNEELTVEYLELLNTESDKLIDDVLGIMNNSKVSGFVDVNFTNIFLNGLVSLKSLNINSDDYLKNIENLMSSVIQKEQVYNNKLENLESEILEIGNQYDSLVAKFPNNTEVKSDVLQKEIVNEANMTLKSVCSNLTPEAVIRLLQN